MSGYIYEITLKLFLLRTPTFHTPLEICSLSAESQSKGNLLGNTLRNFQNLSGHRTVISHGSLCPLMECSHAATLGAFKQYSAKTTCARGMAEMCRTYLSFSSTFSLHFMPQFHLYFLTALCFFTAGSTCNALSTGILEPLPNTLNLFIGCLL